MRAIVVDDSETMRTLETGVLTQMGCTEVAHADDGHGAIDAWTRLGGAEVILIDGTLPCGGAAVARALRARGCRAPIVMVSPRSGPEQVVESIRAGADAYVVKPFTPDLLFQRVREAMARVAA